MHFIASLQGGAAQHVFHLSVGLTSKGHRCTVAAPNDNPGFVEQLRQYNIQYVDVNVSTTFSRRTVVELRALLRSPKYTHVHVHGHRAAAVVRFSSLGMQQLPPLIYTVHGYHPQHYKTSFTKHLANSIEWFLKSKIQHFICVSESTRDELIQTVTGIRKRSSVIHNGIPLLNLSTEEKDTFRQEFREKYGLPQDAFVLGTVARLQWQKSVHRLLQAFSVIQGKYPDMHLVLVGTGPEKESLETLSQNLKCETHIHFLGNVENSRPVYCMMDLFILPSLWEGLPLTVLEAWDARVPVIATDVSGSRDLIDDDVNGFIATNTATGIAQEIEHAYKERERFPEIVSKAKSQLHTEYSVEKMVKKTLSVYQNTFQPAPVSAWVKK